MWLGPECRGCPCDEADLGVVETGIANGKALLAARKLPQRAFLRCSMA